MTDYIMGRIDPGRVRVSAERNSFRPESQQYYNVKHAPTFRFIETRDQNGNTVIRKYDVIKCVFVND